MKHQHQAARRNQMKDLWSVYLCVCVCVCVWERERAKDKEGKRDSLVPLTQSKWDFQGWGGGGVCLWEL